MLQTSVVVPTSSRQFHIPQDCWCGLRRRIPRDRHDRTPVSSRWRTVRPGTRCRKTRLLGSNILGRRLLQLMLHPSTGDLEHHIRMVNALVTALVTWKSFHEQFMSLWLKYSFYFNYHQTSNISGTLIGKKGVLWHSQFHRECPGYISAKRVWKWCVKNYFHISQGQMI